MIDYGAGPAKDQIEVTVFGPGYGEAIAIHLGEENWMLVDSCLEPFTSTPAASSYLDQIGISVDRVRAIVASHWHDDHVRGISGLASKYGKAEFFLSTVFNDKEAGAFLAAYSGKAAPGQVRGTTELFNLISGRDSVAYVHHRSMILELNQLGRQIRATAYSPLPGAFAQALAHMAEYLPRRGGGSPISHAPDLKPNVEAVAIHIDFGDDAILLGSDLEEHAANGWTAIVANKWSGNRRKASAFKVAHHGSYTGDAPGIWSNLLLEEPLAVLTPFNLGKHSLPSEADKARLRSKTSRLYTSSGATRKPNLDSANKKRLSDICKNLTRLNSGFGAVRMRKKLGAHPWDVECFGFAQAL